MAGINAVLECDIQNRLSELVGVPKAFWGGSLCLGVHWAVARRTVKVDAVHGFDDPKAFGKAIHLYIERAIHLRKLGGAGLFALGTAKTFNPTVAGRHLPNMRLRLLRFNPASAAALKLIRYLPSPPLNALSFERRPVHR